MRSIAIWGCGWCVGAIVLFLLPSLDDPAPGAITAIVYLAAGSAAFGVPTYLATRAQGSRQALRQALVWITGFTLAGLLLAGNYRALTGLARPGDLNINTTETMQARQESFRRWGKPPEEISAVVFIITAVPACCFGTATLAALVAGGWSTRRAMPAAWFGMMATIGISAGLLLTPVAFYILMVVFSIAALPFTLAWLGLPAIFAAASMLAGGVAGAIIEHTRAALLVRAPAWTSSATS